VPFGLTSTIRRWNDDKGRRPTHHVERRSTPMTADIVVGWHDWSQISRVSLIQATFIQPLFTDQSVKMQSASYTFFPYPLQKRMLHIALCAIP